MKTKRSEAVPRLSTRRRLWLGFGVLIAIQIGTLLGIAFGLRGLQDNLQQLTEHAQPLRRAAYEMEVASFGVSMATWRYLHNAEPGVRERIDGFGRQFRQAHEAYGVLGTSPRERELSRQIGQLFAEIRSLSDILIATKDRGGFYDGLEMQRFGQVRDELGEVLDQGIKRLAEQEMLAGKSVAHRAMDWMLAALLFLLVAVPLLAMLTSLVVARAIIRSEETLRVTLASIGDGVITTDAAGRVTMLNEVAAKLTGWTATEAHDQPLETVFHIVDETTREKVSNPALRAIREGVVVGLANHTVLIARDGRECPIDDSAAPIRDAQDKVAGSVLIFRDFTDRRQMEKSLREAAHAAAESDRRKSEFLALLAHELRNPLAPISNAVQILQQIDGPAEAADGSQEQSMRREVVELMERQMRQMVRLVDDLLDVSRISRGKMELRRERVDLAATVRHAIEAVRPFIERNGALMHVNLPAVPVTIDADPARLSQILANLLNNAAKFSRPAGEGQPEIRLDAELDDEGQLVLRVRDNGIGIAPGELLRIFGMFTQSEGGLSRPHDGLGIGLALVKALVEMHGGSVEARSAGLGQGSEFILRLPIVADAHAGPATPPATSSAASPRSVLVVDDHRASADLMAILLSNAGYRVRTAHDGSDALAQAALDPPDVVLLDIGLPRMNGYETAQRMRAEPWGRASVLIALTGWSRPEDVQRAYDAGFDHHLVKPVRHTDLLELLANPGKEKGGA